MVMVIEQKMVNAIADCGRSSAPNEACGLLLPYAVNGVQVIELPNRSSTPRDSFEMRGEDMLMALERAFRGVATLEELEEIIPKIAAWHTHPAGNMGPSEYDLKNKPENFKSLVVTLFTDGSPPLPTWY